MKNMKRIFSLVLALVMMMALTVSVASAAEGDITIANGMKGKTYDAYRIFDVSYNEGKTSFSYTLPSNSPWMAVVEKYFTVTPSASNPEVSVAEVKDGFSAPAFAADLELALYGREAVKNEDGDVVTDAIAPTVTATPDKSATASADGSVTLATGKLGYYLVTGGMGSLCNLTNTTPTATIYDKNEKPVIDKTVDDDDNSVYVGQELNYTITGKIPDTTGYDNYRYEITDTMGKGLTYKQGSITVDIDRVNVAEGDVTISENENGFVVTIKVDKMQQSIGAEIRVNYSATVNKEAIGAPADATTNKATLNYSNNPNTVDVGKHESNVTVYTADLKIVKYDGGTATVNDENKLVAKDPEKAIKYLSGAEFKLARLNPDVLDAAFAGAYQYYVVDATTKNVTWTDKIEDATPIITGADGTITVTGLETGDYMLIETKAPTGYNLLTEGVELSVVADAAQVTVTQNVENLSGTELPATGGIGTTIFTVTGGLLMIGAAILFLTKKRSEG